MLSERFQLFNRESKISNSIPCTGNTEKINFERYPRNKDSKTTDPSVTRISCFFEFLYRNENSGFLSVYVITTKIMYSPGKLCVHATKHAAISKAPAKIFIFVLSRWCGKTAAVSVCNDDSISTDEFGFLCRTRLSQNSRGDQGHTRNQLTER